MQQTIIFNGRTVPVFRVEAGDFFPANRVEVPSGVEDVPDDAWDRRFLILTDKEAIEITIELSEIIVSPDADFPESKYARAYRNFPKWEQETSGDKIREIILATPRASTGKVLFESCARPAVFILARDLRKDEKAIVLQEMMHRKLATVESVPVKKSGSARLESVRRKGGASTFKLKAHPDAYHFLIRDVKRRSKSYGNRKLARAIREGLAAFRQRYPDLKHINLSANTVRNMVMGKTGVAMKRNFKR